MSNSFKVTQMRFNGLTWDTIYAATIASQVAETGGRKWLSAVNKELLERYLVGFNASDKLIKADEFGFVPVANIPVLDYLPLIGGKISGSVEVLNQVTARDLLVKEIFSIDGDGPSSTTTTLQDDHVAVKVKVGSKVRTFKVGVDEIDLAGAEIVGASSAAIKSTSLVTRAWVEQYASQGTHTIAAVVAASDVDVTPTTGTNKLIDGKAIKENDRILLMGQANASQNGVYIVKSGAWQRLARDSDPGSLAFVLTGNINRGKQFQCTGSNEWVLFQIQNTYYVTASGGLEVSEDGLGLGIGAAGVTNAMLAGSIGNSKIASWVGADNVAVTAATASKALSVHINQLYSQIKNLRGSAAFNTAVTQTIAGAYTLATGRNRTFLGTAIPTADGYVSGDVYYKSSGTL